MKNLFKYTCIFLFWNVFSGTFFSQEVTYSYSWYKYFEPIEGKIMGVWPHLSRWHDIEKLKELKYRWGFNYILSWTGLGQDDLNRAYQIGYKASNIMRIIDPVNYKVAGQYEDYWAYYVDEPADRQIPFNTVRDMKSWLKNRFPNSKFIISGYKRTSQLKNYTRSLADNVLFSAYKHWWQILGVWISWPVNPDQRSDWTDMKKLFGDKFSITWTSAYKDLSDYNELLGHAANLGLKGVWLYYYNENQEAIDDNNNFNSFCNAAANSGFLRVKYQQVKDYFIDGVFSSRQFVGLPYPSVPTTYDHSSLVFSDVTVTNNRVDDYFAPNMITAGSPFFFTIPSLKKSTFNSNNEIILKPGFHAQPGSEFRAYITQETNE